MRLKKSIIILFCLTFVISSSIAVYALSNWNEGYKAIHASSVIVRYNSATGTRAQVTSTETSTDYFIPTKTTAEWTAFKNKKPSKITICEPTADCSWGTWTLCSATNCGYGTGGTGSKCGEWSVTGIQTRTSSGGTCGGTACSGSSSQSCSKACSDSCDTNNFCSIPMGSTWGECVSTCTPVNSYWGPCVGGKMTCLGGTCGGMRTTCTPGTTATCCTPDGTYTYTCSGSTRTKYNSCGTVVSTETCANGCLTGGTSCCIPDCAAKRASTNCGTTAYSCGTNCGAGTYCVLGGYTCSGGSCVFSGCVPNCGCASNTCTGSTCSDGCGGNCAGTKTCTPCTRTCTGTCYGTWCSGGTGTCCL